MTLKKLLAIGFTTFLLVGCMPAEEADPTEENIMEEEVGESEEEDQTCFVMSDGECYEPGENVADTDCIVNEEGGCKGLDEISVEANEEPECFVMSDGNCYKPGETIPDTGCKVNNEGGCMSLDEM